MWLRLFPRDTTTGKSPGEGSFSKLELTAGPRLPPSNTPRALRDGGK